MSNKNKLPDVLSVEQLVKIFDAVDDPKIAIATAVTFFCGLRISEICKLRIEDIDFENKKLKVVDSKFSMRTKTKYGKDRYVIIPDMMIGPIQKWLVFFIMASFALLIFGSANYQLIYIGLILLFFVMYNKVKHEEWKVSGKHVSAKWFRIRGKPARWFGAGIFAIIYGLLILIGAIYVADKGYKYEAHHTIADFIGARIAWGLVIGSIGIASIILGFWMIRFSYRNPYYSANFEVLEPGKVVISREGIINNRTLKEYSNN